MPDPIAELRPLGATERVIDLYVSKHPMHFCLVAELDVEVGAAELDVALRAVQRRHPLLGCSVDDSGNRPVFARSAAAVPVEVAASGTPWQWLVARAQTRPFPAGTTPLLRVDLVPGPRSVLVLTFAHQVADGVGGVRVVLDLLESLGGADLGEGPVPSDQEELLTAQQPDAGQDGPAAAAEDAGPPAVPDPAEVFAPFTGQLPHLDSLALDAELTAALVTRARAERTTVQGALLAAASTVLHRRGRAEIQALSPVDLRRTVGLADELVVRFVSARTTSRDGDDDFWTRARDARAQLVAQLDPAGLLARAAMITQAAPATPEEAETMMALGAAADVQITNLGAVTPGPHGTSVLRALWGPAQITQLRGEHLVGVLTCAGRLRLVELTPEPLPALLPELVAELAAAASA